MIIVRIAGFTKLADFNPPKKGTRIEVNGAPRFEREQYWLVDNVSGNARAGWNAEVRGQDGNRINMHSSDVQSWQAYNGDLYDWENREIETKKRRREEEEKERFLQQHRERLSEISGKYRFPSGEPLVIPASGLLVNVKEDAAGQLDLFAGKTLRALSVDPETETVKMEPVIKDDPSLIEFAQFIEAVPAAEVTQNCIPVFPAAVANRKVTVPDMSAPADEKGKRPSKRIEEADIPGMVPHLVQAILRGQVKGPYRDGKFVEVFVNYDKDQGLSRFKQEMAAYGVDYPEEEIHPNNARYTERYLESDVPMKSPMHYYSGAIEILNPSDELIEELQKVAPASRIQRRGSSVVVQSNTLFRLYVKLSQQQRPMVAARTRVVVKIAGFGRH